LKRGREKAAEEAVGVMSERDMGFVALRRMHRGGDRMIAREGGRVSDLQNF